MTIESGKQAARDILDRHEALTGKIEQPDTLKPYQSPTVMIYDAPDPIFYQALTLFMRGRP